MRQDDLRVFLIFGGHDDDRNPFLYGRKGLNHVSAHIEIDFAGEQKDRVVGLGTAGHNRYVKSIFCVGAVCDCLIVAAMFRIGEPVQSETHLIGRRRLSRTDHGKGAQRRKSEL